MLNKLISLSNLKILKLSDISDLRRLLIPTANLTRMTTLKSSDHFYEEFDYDTLNDAVKKCQHYQRWLLLNMIICSAVKEYTFLATFKAHFSKTFPNSNIDYKIDEDYEEENMSSDDSFVNWNVDEKKMMKLSVKSWAAKKIIMNFNFHTTSCQELEYFSTNSCLSKLLFNYE